MPGCFIYFQNGSKTLLSSGLSRSYFWGQRREVVRLWEPIA